MHKVRDQQNLKKATLLVVMSLEKICDDPLPFLVIQCRDGGPRATDAHMTGAKSARLGPSSQPQMFRIFLENCCFDGVVVILSILI